MSIYETHPLAPSPLALEQAGDAWPQVEAAIRADLERELGDKLDFMMNVVRTAENGDYYCWPDEDHRGVFVDACAWEDKGVLDAGPFKGKLVRMPRPASFPPEES